MGTTATWPDLSPRPLKKQNRCVKKLILKWLIFHPGLITSVVTCFLSFLPPYYIDFDYIDIDNIENLKKQFK